MRSNPNLCSPLTVLVALTLLAVDVQGGEPPKPPPKATALPVAKPHPKPAPRVRPRHSPKLPLVNVKPVLRNKGTVFRHDLGQRHGRPLRVTIRAHDANRDPLTFRAKGLPRGAQLSKQRNYALITWQPTYAQLGRHDFRLHVSDGELGDSGDYALMVVDNWKTLWLPRVGYSVYAPGDGDSHGVLHGTSIEIVVVAWIHDNRRRGPSHGRVFLAIEALSSTKAGHDRAMLYGLGMDLSLERQPTRRFLVPIFGFELGGLYMPGHGHTWQATPVAGLHLWSQRNLFLTWTAGYLYTWRDIEPLAGWRTKLGLSFSLW